MSKPIPYAKFLYILNELSKERADPEFDGCEDILAFMYIKDLEGKQAKITDLVQSLRFGTGPTVHRKVATLEARGLISVAQSKTDGRAKDLRCTSKGLAVLKDRSKLMQQCLD